MLVNRTVDHQLLQWPYALQTFVKIRAPVLQNSKVLKVLNDIHQNKSTFLRHFQMHFDELKVLYFDSIPQLCCWEPNWQLLSISASYSLGSNKPQAIIWTNTDLVDQPFGTLFSSPRVSLCVFWWNGTVSATITFGDPLLLAKITF